MRLIITPSCCAILRCYPDLQSRLATDDDEWFELAREGYITQLKEQQNMRLSTPITTTTTTINYHPNRNSPTLITSAVNHHASHHPLHRPHHSIHRIRPHNRLLRAFKPRTKHNLLLQSHNGKLRPGCCRRRRGLGVHASYAPESYGV